MCVIIDANVISEIFGSRSGEGAQSEAGKQLFNWLDEKPERLVIGGSKLREELRSDIFKRWLQEVDRAGELRKHDDKEVDQKAQDLRDKNACESNDEHIIALAQISRARLLYSRDNCLCKDFKDAKLINHPRGKIFPTGDNFHDDRRRILSNESLCKK